MSLKNKLHLISFIIPLVFWISYAHAQFKFHLVDKPHSLDPSELSTSDTSYLFSNLFRGLYRYHSKKGLIEEEAKSCKWLNSKKLQCELRKDIFWSDGTPVTADDYVNGFQRLIRKESKARDIGLILNLKNAKKIWSGKSEVSELGIKKLSSHSLLFTFDKSDPDFLYKLTSPILVPIKKVPQLEELENNLFNGPYILKQLEQQKAILHPNQYYKRGHPKRPVVEVLFLDDDITAINLFDKGALSFLRRIPTSHLNHYKNHPGLMKVPLARFDYLGFGPQLKKYPKLREALALSLDYEEFQRLFDSIGRPGCTSVPLSYLSKDHCYNFNLKKARSLYKDLNPEIKNRIWKLGFSQAGGDDIKKSAEWFQAQWKKHLNLKIELFSQENKVFTQTLKTKPPALFRRGVPLDRPNCLAALETFSEHSEDNFIHYENKNYQKIVNNWGQYKSPGSVKKKCSQAIDTLLKDHVLIPLGRFFYIMVLDPHYLGLDINELNQIDLSQLHNSKL